MNLAPIGISTYSRVHHLQTTIDALKCNPLANDSDLYVFSDAPSPGDEEVVRQVRRALGAIEGFKSVHIIEREENSRVFNSREGIRSLLDQYGKLIWLEEDIVTAPSFLSFMNHALTAYEDNREIFSVTGYRPPIAMPREYTADVFTLPRFCGWGFGIWKDRYELLPMSIEKREFYKFLMNPRDVFNFTRGGWDMLRLLRKEVRGDIDALDVKIFFRQFRLGMSTVYPARPLTRNIGHDGTGVHCSPTSRFEVDLDTDIGASFVLPKHLPPDERIVKENFKFRSMSYKHRARLLVQLITDFL